MNMKNIILGIIILIILYVLYLYYFGDASKKALVGMHDATVQTTVSAGSMPPGTSQNYTFSIWVYVSDWNYGIGKFKPVFVRGAVIRAIVTSVSFITGSVTKNVTIETGYYKTLKNANKTKKPASSF